MGDYGCSEEFYGYEVEEDCRGYENSHDRNLGRFESYCFEGENEVNELPSAYGDFGDDVGRCDGSYDDFGACEESYPSHSKPRFGVRYNPFVRKAYESYDESTCEECEDSYSPPCSTSYQDRYSVNSYTSSSGGCSTRRRGYASPKPRGTRDLYNVDPRRSVHSVKVTICGIPGCLIVLNDRYYRNYIVPSMVDYLGLFCKPLLIPYFLDGFKIIERVKVVFSQFQYHEEVWYDILPLTYGHICLGVDWFAQHRVPNVQNRPNIIRDQWGNHLMTYMLPELQREVNTYSNPNAYERKKIERSKGVQGGNPRVEKKEVMWSKARGSPPNRDNIVCPPISKDIYVGTDMESDGDQCQSEVAAQSYGGPSQHGKGELTQELQGKIANSYTFVHMNDNCVASSPLSVSSRLLTCDSNDSLTFVNNVHVVSVDTLVDPIDDQIESSYHALFRYNVLFEDDINTPNEPSGENEGIVFLGSYSRYANPLWCDNIPPKDENLFLKDESTLMDKECVVLLENPRTNVSLTPWGNVPKCASLFDTLVPKLHEFQLVDAKLSRCLKERMSMCLNTYSSPVNSFTCDSFLYYLFAFDDFHASFGFVSCRGTLTREFTSLKRLDQVVMESKEQLVQSGENRREKSPVDRAYKSARMQEAYLTAIKPSSGFHSFSTSKKSTEQGLQSKLGLLPTLTTGYEGPQKSVNRRTLSIEEMNDRRSKGLGYFCDERYTFGYKCKTIKQLYLLEIEERDKGGDDQILEMVDPKESQEVEMTNTMEQLKISIHVLNGSLGYRTLKVTGYHFKKPLHILIDTGSCEVVLGVQWLLTLGDIKMNFKKSPWNSTTKGRNIVSEVQEVKSPPQELEKWLSFQNWPVSTTLKQLRGFLGLIGYHRRFIQGFGIIARPLTDFLKRDNFKWSNEAAIAFATLKERLTQAPVLALRDATKLFIVETDASGTGIGVVHMQEGHPIAFISKAISPKHTAKSVYDRELLAIVQSVTKWSQYLLGQKFGGNSGIETTLKILLTLFYWKGLQSDVQKFIHACDVCQKNKANLAASPGLLQTLVISDVVWYQISMYFITGLPNSRGNEVILVVDDRAQLRMKQQADLHRSDRSFEVGDWVYFKTQPNRQQTGSTQSHHKLSARYYGPFQIIKKFGLVAYNLLFPADVKIHLAVHVSLLKKCYELPATISYPPTLDIAHSHCPSPESILQRRMVKKGNKVVSQVLV
ncbi:hypothetical protein FXO37_30327 [Capsicum annuum]|nr:hypothetical protein FXO37_30327 [Capsicum annuum]